MKQAEIIKATARSPLEARVMADRTAIALDQKWADRATVWTFDDNSTLTICGGEVTAKDWDAE